VAKNPDPSLVLTTITGRSRTLDDWTTVFNLCLICLPGRPEAARYAPPGHEILRVFRGADCRGAFVINGSERQARLVLGPEIDETLVFLDEDGEFVRATGISRLPAFVHIGIDCSIVAAVEGWDPDAWTEAAKELATAMSWTYPVFNRPPAFAGWST